MTYLRDLFSAVLTLFRMEITIFEVTFSWWQVFVFSVVTGIVARILYKLFLGD